MNVSVASEPDRDSKSRRNFAGMVSALDDSLPQVVQALKTKKMWANSVLIVTTDNGGNIGGSGNNWPLRQVLAPSSYRISAQ